MILGNIFNHKMLTVVYWAFFPFMRKHSTQNFLWGLFYTFTKIMKNILAPDANSNKYFPAEYFFHEKRGTKNIQK